MKKGVYILLVLLIALVPIMVIGNNSGNEQYIRLHIRANSNSEADQSVKYAVKDAIVEALKPLASQMTSKSQMYDLLSSNIEVLERIAEKELLNSGYSYGARVRLDREKFPARTYGDLTLESGIYDALIIELGTGGGDNWWCVAFPPLCFIPQGDGESVEYRSKLAEWWNALFA